MAQGARTLVSYEEYLALAAGSEEPLEYHDGLVVAMGAPTPAHARLCGRLVSLLSARLAGGPCGALPAGLKVRVEATNRTLLPDVTVVCGDLERSPRDPDAIVSPRVVIEVLSPSTEDYDLGSKFHHYRRIAGLEEIGFVAQDRRHVRVARRAGDLWAFDDVEGAGSLSLRSVGVELALVELYEDAFGIIAPE